jgi:RNA polymerase sigma factor (sigma-70 family)
MKIATVASEILQLAQSGDLLAIDTVLHTIQPGVFNLAVRMLGNREDARDATQEILLKVTTHLGSFRGDSAFSTWVYQVARNQLLTAASRARESPEVSFEDLSEQLQFGLALGQSTWQERSLSPEDKAAARETAVTCTQGMLMRLDRDHRLAYVLDVTFGLPSEEAAQVLGIEAAAYRKRLSRARQMLDEFSSKVCGMVNPEAACRCEKQNHALQIHSNSQATKGAPRASIRLRLEPAEREAASHALDEVMLLSDMAGVMRTHPAYQAPDALLAGIRTVLGSYRHGIYGQGPQGVIN